LPVAQATKIVTLYKSSTNIRSIVNGGDLAQINTLNKAIAATLLKQIESHVGVNLRKAALSTASDAEKSKLEAQFDALESCTEFVKVQFPEIGVFEIEDAFSMLSAGKLTADVRTFGWVFEPMHLGRVLFAYTKFRRGVIAEYEKKHFIANKEKTDEEKEALQEKANKYAILEYKALLRYFQEINDPSNKEVAKWTKSVVEDSVKSYWGKILVSSGIIKLSNEERQIAKGEAKERTLNELKNARIDGRKKDVDRLAATEMIKSIGNKGQDGGFTAKWQARYSKIVIIKSILNS
jgi:hypothetical protein